MFRLTTTDGLALCAVLVLVAVYFAAVLRADMRRVERRRIVARVTAYTDRAALADPCPCSPDGLCERCS